MMEQTQNSAEDLCRPGPEAQPRRSWRRYLATSDRPVPSAIRKLYRGVRTFSVPAPRAIVRPILWAFLACRSLWHFVLRVFVAEPLFKAYCKDYGRDIRTDEQIHWVEGKGDIILGDDVRIGGQCSIQFAARFSDRPTLRIGSNVGIGHACIFTIGKQITIGSNCQISGGCWIADSNGHTADLAERTVHKAPSADDVRPVVIGDGVWLGRQCLIFPGVKIGEGSVISAGSVVRTHIPPYSVVAGNPAKVIFRMKPAAKADTARASSVPPPDSVSVSQT
jgi:acetyltransferase-like isoleucine patch superfamily enzyme